jgi:hypothetical protein
MSRAAAFPLRNLREIAMQNLSAPALSTACLQAIADTPVRVANA